MGRTGRSLQPRHVTRVSFSISCPPTRVVPVVRPVACQPQKLPPVAPSLVARETRTCNQVLFSFCFLPDSFFLTFHFCVSIHIVSFYIDNFTKYSVSYQIKIFRYRPSLETCIPPRGHIKGTARTIYSILPQLQGNMEYIARVQILSEGTDNVCGKGK